jgi:hypothetical protein
LDYWFQSNWMKYEFWSLYFGSKKVENKFSNTFRYLEGVPCVSLQKRKVGDKFSLNKRGSWYTGEVVPVFN